MNPTIYHRQDRDTGEISQLSERELRGYIAAHRGDVAGVLEEMRGGMVLHQTFFNYAISRLLFSPVANVEAVAR